MREGASMNICIVFFSYGVWGGAERLVHELAQNLAKRGQDVSLILNEEVWGDFKDISGIKLVNVGRLFPAKGRRKRNLLLRLVHVPGDMVRRHTYHDRARDGLKRFLCSNRVDVIHPICEDALPMVANLVTKGEVPRMPMLTYIFGEPHLRGVEPVPLRTRFFRKREAKRFKDALTKMDKIVAVSAFMVKAWEEQGVYLDDKSIVILGGNKIAEIQGYSNSPSKLKGEFNLLFPGGARWIKGGDLVLQCLPKVKKEIPNVHLYVALNVPQDHILRKMVRDLGLEQNVTFVGFLHTPEYLTLLNSVDMFVMPSRQEAGGAVYEEAMALGKPIVGPNTGGVPEYVKNGRNGILTDLDPDQIAEAIIHLYRNENLRRDMSRNSRQDAMLYDWSNVVDQYINVYRELCQVGD